VSRDPKLPKTSQNFLEVLHFNQGEESINLVKALKPTGEPCMISPVKKLLKMLEVLGSRDLESEGTNGHGGNEA